MEPEHVLEDDGAGATPAPQVELIDQQMDRPIEPVNALPAPRTVVDENGWRDMRAASARAEVTEAEEAPGEAEVPYLRMRNPSEASGLRTPTPLLDDLTDLAIPMPEPPATPPLPLMEIHAVSHLDPADETGVGLLPLEALPRRVSLSRPWFASLGVLAFAAGLLTAAGAGVVARPVRSAAAASPVAQVTAGSTVATAPATAAPPATNPVVAAAPAETRVAVAAAEAPAAAPSEVVEPIANPAAATPVAAGAPARPAPSARSAAAGAGGTKLRSRGNGSTSRGRTRATKIRPEPRGESAIAQDAADAAPLIESKEAAPAPTQHRRPPDWVDPFAQ